MFIWRKDMIRLSISGQIYLDRSSTKPSRRISSSMEGDVHAIERVPREKLSSRTVGVSLQRPSNSQDRTLLSLSNFPTLRTAHEKKMQLGWRFIVRSAGLRKSSLNFFRPSHSQFLFVPPTFSLSPGQLQPLSFFSCIPLCGLGCISRQTYSAVHSIFEVQWWEGVDPKLENR